MEELPLSATDLAQGTTSLFQAPNGQISTLTSLFMHKMSLLQVPAWASLSSLAGEPLFSSLMRLILWTTRLTHKHVFVLLLLNKLCFLTHNTSVYLVISSLA